MTIDADIFDRMSGGAVGVADRVYPVTVRQDVPLPQVTYQRISAYRIRSHDGDSLVMPLYQFSCWAATASEAKAVARSVKALWAALVGLARVESDGESYAAGQKLYHAYVDVRMVQQPEVVVS